VKKSIIGLVVLGILLVATGRDLMRPTNAFQESCPICSTPPLYTCSLRDTFDFPSIAANSTAEMTITVAGAVDRDEVIITPSAGMEAGLVWVGYVSGADTVVIRVANVTGSAIDPFNRRIRITVNHYN
jgi:hypothetical protein